MNTETFNLSDYRPTERLVHQRDSVTFSSPMWTWPRLLWRLCKVRSSLDDRSELTMPELSRTTAVLADSVADEVEDEVVEVVSVVTEEDEVEDGVDSVTEEVEADEVVEVDSVVTVEVEVEVLLEGERFDPPRRCHFLTVSVELEQVESSLPPAQRSPLTKPLSPAISRHRSSHSPWII